MNLYSNKAKTYFTNVRMDLVSILDTQKDIKVLEIGAGGGDTILFLKEEGIAKEVVGVDIFSLEGTNQKHDLIDEFIIVDIEKNTINYPEKYFDVVLCGDVIEHLVDPWAVIEKLAYFIKPGGQIIISTPNFRHWKNFLTIFIKGDFKYDPKGGLLDKTHLRFFCKKNIRELVNQKYFDFVKIEAINNYTPYRHRLIVRLFNLITFKAFEQLLVSQYIVIAEKK